MMLRKIINLNTKKFIIIIMNRLNILFFIIFISLMHNYFSQFNDIFLKSSLFLFLFELINVKFFNKNNNKNEDNDDSAVSDIVSDIVDEKESEETEENESEETEENESEETEESEEESDYKEETNEKKVSTDIKETDDKEETNNNYINQMDIIRLLSNYDNLGDTGLMELKNKMQELDNLVELYRNDIKKMDDYDIIEDN